MSDPLIGLLKPNQITGEARFAISGLWQYLPAYSNYNDVFV